jgi:hypothetical protein
LVWNEDVVVVFSHHLKPKSTAMVHGVHHLWLFKLGKQRKWRGSSLVVQAQHTPYTNLIYPQSHNPTRVRPFLGSFF